MDLVQFVTIEDGDDLVLSFSFNEGTKFGVDGFIIQRSPKLEFTLYPHERGACIDWTDDDERILIKEVNLSRKSIMLKSQYDTYWFDLTKITDKEYQNVIYLLNRMNFDNSYKFTHQQS